MNFLNALAYGGITAVIGIFIVFLGLAILIAAVLIMGKIIETVTGRQEAAKAAAAKAAPAPAPVQAPVAAPVVEEPAEEVTDPELIAVIAAAIAAFDSGNKSLVVRKVRRVSGWNRSARAEQVYRF